MSSINPSDKRAEQMDPYPLPEDLNPPRPVGPGHGEGLRMHSQKRGILVSAKKLKIRGVSLTKVERRAASYITGELVIERVHDRSLDFQSRAEILIFRDRGFPSRQAVLCNPVVFAADARGMVLHGIEKLPLVDGGGASYHQAWLVYFGSPPPEPPI